MSVQSKEARQYLESVARVNVERERLQRSREDMAFDRGFEEGQLAASRWPDFLVGTCLGIVASFYVPPFLVPAWRAVVAFFNLA